MFSYSWVQGKISINNKGHAVKWHLQFFFFPHEWKCFLKQNNLTFLLGLFFVNSTFLMYGLLKLLLRLVQLDEKQDLLFHQSDFLMWIWGSKSFSMHPYCLLSNKKKKKKRRQTCKYSGRHKERKKSEI